ncbi:MAG: DUF1365 domain-containing protein [Candidatus Limnocylindria bacterium]
MRSHLAHGIVRHRRSRPFIYEMDHDVFYFALDLDELDEVAVKVRLVGRNRARPHTFRDADHLDPPAADVRSAIHARLREIGHDPAGWRITLLTNLRFLGYVFNPASFYLCRDAAGALQAVVVEVHNTHGERHIYDLQPRSPDGPFAAGMEKEFYVSPFIAVGGRYEVRVRDEPTRLRVTINHYDATSDAPLLHTSLDLARRPLTDRSLLRMTLRHLAMTQRTIGLIHWHALRLWRRGARHYPHQPAHR